MAAKSKMESAFLDLLRGDRVRMTDRDRLRLSKAIGTVAELESKMDASVSDNLRETWFYYGWQAAMKALGKEASDGE